MKNQNSIQITEDEIESKALEIVNNKLKEINKELKKKAKEIVSENVNVEFIRDVAKLVSTIMKLGTNAIMIRTTWNVKKMIEQGWSYDDLEIYLVRIDVRSKYGFEVQFKCPNGLWIAIDCKVKKLEDLSKSEYNMVEPLMTRILNNLLMTYIKRIVKSK